jgi:TonB-linked outer membrane protein, SusC/RagA family
MSKMLFNIKKIALQTTTNKLQTAKQTIMRRFLTLLVTLLVFGAGSALGQVKQVSGRVFSTEDKNPIPGVSVLVKEAPTVGTTTNLEGQFTLKNLPANAKTLIFRFVGYQTQEVAIKGGEINVSLLPETQRIEEVVVTAMGMKRDKKALGYASQDIKADQLNKTGNSGLSTALQGKVSGVDIKPSSGMPGASSNITIRGARSFMGDNSPMYIVDGMPIASTADFSTGSSVTGTDISNRASDIDPNEIESINILKGQAAAALYGIRASNGVVVITTKSGKGQAKGKPVVSISNSTSIEQISRFPDRQNMYVQGSYGSFNPNTSMSWGPTLASLPDDPTYGGNPGTAMGSAATQGKYYVPQLASAGLDPWSTPTRYNNPKDFFNTGSTVSNSINVSQATESGNYSVGIGSTNQKGIVPSTSMDRYTAKAAAETKLNKEWRSGFSTNFVTTNIDKAPGANSALLATVYPAPINYNLKGIPYHIAGDPYTQTNYRSLTFNNPYWGAANNKFNEKTDRFYGNSFLEYTPNINWSEDKKLSFKYQFGIDSYTTHYQDIYEFGNVGKLGSIDNYGITHLGVNSLLTANYSMNFGENLQFNALLGNEVNQNNDKTYDQTGQDFNFGGYKNINNAITLTNSETQIKNRTVGFFGNLSLTYKNMIFLNATGRNDYVSTMPRNNRSFFYPSVSLSWVLTELDPLKNNSIVSFAKIRASYAQVGQAGTYLNNYFAKPSYGGGFWNGTPINYPLGLINVSAFTPYSTIYDPKLKPQNTKSYEAGFDLKLFKNIFSVEYTYARQNVTDQIFPVPLAGSTGVVEQVMNGGKIHTNSHEVIVNIRLLSTNDLDWNIGGNFTKIDNYVDELAPGVESIFLGGFTTPQVRAGIGDKYPVIYGTQFKRDAKGRVLVDEDPTSGTYGMPMAGDPGVIGKCSPDFIVGGNTNFRYKRVSLSATLSWQKGGQMYSGSNGLMSLYGMSKTTQDRTTPFVYPGYKADGTPNNIVRGGKHDPQAYQDLYSTTLGNIDEAYIYDQDFVKLRELTLAYAFPKYKGVTVNLSAFARNILIWSKLPNFDPESSQGNNNMGGYFERFSMPQTTSFGMGLNIVF